MIIVLPVMPFCVSSSAPLPRNSCLMINLAELASIRMASVAFLKRG